MTFQPAYDIPLAYGGNTVWLRPSLRAAIRLEALHKGFPALLTKIQQFDTTALRLVITYAATDRNAAQALLRSMENQPLRLVQNAVLGPVLALVAALMMSGTDTDAEATRTPTKPIAWADLYADLFKMATGRLCWTPEATWNATVPEILQAIEGHTDWFLMMHGGAEGDETGPTKEQRAENEELGLDPEFDRAGLAALKEISTQREGMAA